MSKIRWFLVMSLVIVILVSSGGRTVFGRVSDADEETLVKGNNKFAFELYTKLKEQEGNLFFSPYSISTALAMTSAGARGNTEKQMAKVLHFDLEQERLHPAFRALITRLNTQGKKGGYQLNIANALWAQKGYGFLEEFFNLIKTNYDAGLQECNFKTKTGIETARNDINNWVKKQTSGKIEELIAQGILNPLTRLVLTNAIYFKGYWVSPFLEEATKQLPFTKSSGEKVNVPMMYQRGDFKFMETPKFQIIELPYVGNELSMVVVLPRKVDGLSELEKSLTTDNLRGWLENLKPQEVDVYLPKFKMTLGFRLDEVLKSMGMSDAFYEGTADFSGMTGTDNNLFIAAVIHKAFVEVNEEGTEAAAATAVIISESWPQIIFRADRPFMFLIRDIRSGSILFLGRLSNPA